MATNPVKEIRTSLGKSQRELASIAGVTEQVVLKAEQGLYPDLPPSILLACGKLTGQTINEIDSAYRLWIKEELKSVKLPPTKLPTTHRLFPLWRAELCKLNDVPDSVNALCKLLKINPYVIQKWEAGKMKQRPLQIAERVAFIRGEWNG